MAGTKNYGSINSSYGPYFPQDMSPLGSHKESTAGNVSEDELKKLPRLREITLTRTELGQGSCATVYEAEYSGTMCAVKWLDVQDRVVQDQTVVDSHSQMVKTMKQNFLLECLQHNKLNHQNIVRMLGVFYPKKETILPVLVMERMEYNLTHLLKRSHNIPMYVKLSILQDVSRGLCYLHAQNPPIVHHALYSDNILLTKGLTAKIADFKTGASTVLDQLRLRVRHHKRYDGFLPDLLLNLEYKVSVNVFSFGCIVCHVITQQWPDIQSLNPLPDQTRSKLSDTDFKPKCMKADWDVDRHKNYIDLISDYSLRKLVEACLQSKSKNRPSMVFVHESVNRIITNHCNNDDNIKKAYSLAMKQGLDQSRNFQLLLVGAENTGKTSLISSFLGEEFVEGQLNTEGVDIKICTVDYENWVKISNSDKKYMLCNQVDKQSKEEVLKKMVDSPTPPSPLAYNHSSRKSISIIQSTSVQYLKHTFKPDSQHVQKASSKSVKRSFDGLIASLWDFAGQVIFHNSHSVFISDGGVTMITFDASMKLTDKIIPRKGSPQPPECCTVISSIHYWLQVVNSVCSVKENVLLVGTHIDELHPDPEEAHKIASNKILPVLEEELCGKPYAKHIAGIRKGLKCALEQSCFFISNIYRGEKIEHLKVAAIKIASSLREQTPIFFLKIEQALQELNNKVISLSTMFDLVVQNTSSTDKNTSSLHKNSPEFKGILKCLHKNRIILYFSHVESLKDLVILSPTWLAKLFSYVIAYNAYNVGSDCELDWAWKWLKNCGILHESLLQHMLTEFHSDYPADIQVTKQQVVDILLCFHLLARITSKVRFSEKHLPPLPESGDRFIVPSLLHVDDDRNPPKAEDARIIYFMFNSGFIPASLLNQLIAECICRSVKRNDKLLWMRYGKMASQLGPHQIYYISRYVHDKKQCIQLTITIEKDDKKHVEERRKLIQDIIKLLNDIMKVFMPATKEILSLLIPCLHCSYLHISLVDAYSGKDILCCNDTNGKPLSLPSGYYKDLLQGGLADVAAIIGVDKKREVFTDYYSRLCNLNFEALYPALISAKVINHDDGPVIQKATYPSRIILDKIFASLEAQCVYKFDSFLSVLKNHDDIDCKHLADEMTRDLLKSTTGIPVNTMEQPEIRNSHEEDKDQPRYSDADTSHEEDTEVLTVDPELKSLLSSNTNSTGNRRRSSIQGEGWKCCNLM